MLIHKTVDRRPGLTMPMCEPTYHDQVRPHENLSANPAADGYMIDQG